MTEKDFELLARWLKNDVVYWSGTETRKDLLLHVCSTLTRLLATQNTRFDPLTFLKTCGLEYDDVFDLLENDDKDSWAEWQRKRLDIVAKTEI